MEQVLEAIYSQGVLKPLAELDLPENQRVNIIVSVPDVEDAEQMLATWHEVYAGLPNEIVDEIEAIALDRSHFLNRQP